jgi:hypothetical protein
MAQSRRAINLRLSTDRLLGILSYRYCLVRSLPDNLECLAITYLLT